MTEECRELMEAVKEYVDAHACESFTIKELASKFGLCHNKLSECFKMYCGMSPKQYLQKQKCAELRKLLAEEGNGYFSGYYALKIGLQSSSSLSHFFSMEKLRQNKQR